ncbi:MAG: NUDIX domain-containing protein [Patescibacteria group bacterium]|nr:NUDIX domain-containing protein [Patescibacteria group bacterium]
MEKEKVLLNATLCFLIKNNQILLALKKKKIERECWNGYGGGINDGEIIEEAAIRELKEESGGIIAVLDDLKKVAVIDFHNTKSDGEKFICRVHIYLVRNWIGEPKETEEMTKPTWFNINNLPFENMMPAD